MQRRIITAAFALASCVAAAGSAQAAQLLAIEAPAARFDALSIAEDLAAPQIAPQRIIIKAPTSKKPAAETDRYLDLFDLSVTPMMLGVQPGPQSVDLREIIGGEERPESPAAAEIPAPGALILMLTGLAAFAGSRRNA